MSDIREPACAFDCGCWVCDCWAFLPETSLLEEAA